MKVKTVNKINLISISFFVVFSIGIIAEAAAKTLYVDIDSAGGECSDSTTYNNNDVVHPFCTIQRAADVVNPGDTVIVKDGVYNATTAHSTWHTAVWLTRSGNASNWITFKSENKWGAIVRSNWVYADNVSSHQTGSQHAFGFQDGSANGVSYIKIEDFEITNFDLKAISVNTAGHHWIIKGNKIHDNRAIWHGVSGVFQGPLTNNFTYDSNIFYSNGRLNPSTTPSSDVCLTTDIIDPTGSNHCYTHDHHIYIRGQDSVIKNNIFHKTESGYMIQVSPEVDNLKIINNTFSGPHPNQNGHLKFWIYTTNSTILVQNNIFYEPRGGGAIECVSSSMKATVTVNNNLTSPGKTMLTSKCSEVTAYFTLSNNVIGQDPLFNAGTDVVTLQSNSPAINAGLSTDAPDYDYDGTARSQGDGCDIGAYEWQGIVQNHQCSDGTDNDGDGLIDYPNDPGCSSSTDNDEYNAAPPADTTDINPSGTHIEAENYTETITQGTTAFTLETTQSGYLGSGYLLPSGGAADSCPLVSEGKAYQVNFTSTGVYNIWIRGYSSSASTDSVFIGLDGTCVGAINTNQIHNQWLWTNNLQTGTGVKTINITSPGTHTVNLWVREPNYLIDTLYLTQGTESPDGTTVADLIPPAPPVSLMIQ